MFGIIKSIEKAWGELLESEQYTYDLRGNLTSVIGDIGEFLINSTRPRARCSDNRLQQITNQWGDRSRFSYDGDGNRFKMTVDVAHGPNSRGNGIGQGNGIGNDPSKCGQGEEPYPDEHPGGPRDGWESQHKKKHWEFHYTNDISLALPEVLQVTENDATKWKESFVYGAGMERISMTYLPAYDHDNGWEPTPGLRRGLSMTKKRDNEDYTQYLVILVGLFFVYTGFSSILSGEFEMISRRGNRMGVILPPTSIVISVICILFGILVNYRFIKKFVRYIKNKIK